MRELRAFRAIASSLLVACGGDRTAPAASPTEVAATAAPSSRIPDDASTPSQPLDVDGSANASHADSGRSHGHEPGRGIEDIRAIVVAHRDDARGCYDRALSAHPGMEGDLVMRWTIDPKGNVTQVTSDSARSQIYEPSVIECISKVLSKLQFAPSIRGFETRAFYPFNFHPRPPAPGSRDNLHD